LYTNTLNVPIEYAHSLILLCRQCQLPDLETLVTQELDSATRKSLGRIIIDQNSNPSQSAQTQQHRFWESIRPTFDSSKSDGSSKSSSAFTDICLIVEGRRFPCHRVLLCAQSEYFQSMLCGNFSESSSFKSEIEMPDVAASTFYHVMEHVYSNFIQDLELDTVVDLLRVADLLLMPPLKNLCARQIIKSYLDTTNVVEFLQVAELYNSTRLREYCEDFIEANLDDMMGSEELQEYLNGNGSSVALLTEKMKDKLELLELQQQQQHKQQ